MKKINAILKKCKTLSRQLSRTGGNRAQKYAVQNDIFTDKEHGETIFLGSSRRPYVIASKYLSHPLVNALIEKSKLQKPGEDLAVIKCEVVLFDHLLWMLDNADPSNLTSDSLDELAELYVF